MKTHRISKFFSVVPNNFIKKLLRYTVIAFAVTLILNVTPAQNVSRTAVSDNSKTKSVKNNGKSVKSTSRSIKLPDVDISLRDYAVVQFGTDIDLLQEGIADNRPAIGFSLLDSNQQTNYLIVKHEDHLQEWKTTYPILKVESPVIASTEQHEVSSIVINPQVDNCGGVSSPGNPYPCGNGGNCTFWVWHKAKNVWGQQLPGFSKNSSFPSGDAKYWAGQARLAGWPVSSEPGSRTISVNNNISSFGHVWFNEFLGWQELVGNEMNWGQPGYRDPVKHTFQESNQGYIYPQVRSWRPIVTLTTSPTLRASSQPVWILFSGQNFGSNSIVDATTPDGSMVSLRGSQLYLSNSNNLWMQAVLNMSGMWKFRVVAQDGQRSDYVWLFVNRP